MAEAEEQGELYSLSSSSSLSLSTTICECVYVLRVRRAGSRRGRGLVVAVVGVLWWPSKWLWK